MNEHPHWLIELFPRSRNLGCLGLKVGRCYVDTYQPGRFFANIFGRRFYFGLWYFRRAR